VKIFDRNRISRPKKLKASMVLTIIVFMLSFLVFCICAIDAGHVVVSRYKVQKATETLALYMVSYLNAKPPEERNAAVLDPIKERFERLYSASMNGFYSFKITDIELKNETTTPKIKISTEANIPTLFLKYTGIGIIKIMQVSYAKAETFDMALVDSDTNSYTFEAGDIITDKSGEDINVKYDGDYFIFAGLKNAAGEMFWSDISYAAKAGVKKDFTITLEGDMAHKIGCIEKSSDFDFSNTDEKTIGFIKYVKIYKADCTKELTPPDTTGTGGGTGSEGGAEESAGEAGGTGGEVEGNTPEGGAKEGTEPLAEGGDTGSAEGGSRGGGSTGEVGGTEGTTEGGDGGSSAVSAPEVKILNSVRLIRKSEF